MDNKKSGKDSRNNAKNHQGFTLLEMLVCTTIIAVLISISKPLLSAQQQKNLVQTQMTELKTILNKARQSAIYRKQTVVVCATDESLLCLDNANWQNHIIAFSDTNNNRQLDLDADEPLISSMVLKQAVSSRLSSSYHSKIRFNPSGMTSNPTRFRYCFRQNGLDMSYTFTISMSGRLGKTDEEEGC